MNRRQVLKSCLGVAIGYNFINGKVWGNEWRQHAHEVSEYFSMTVNGISVVVSYAAGSYSFLSQQGLHGIANDDRVNDDISGRH